MKRLITLSAYFLGLALLFGCGSAADKHETPAVIPALSPTPTPTPTPAPTLVPVAPVDETPINTVTGEFRGAAEVEQILTARLFKPSVRFFSLTPQLGGDGLRDLLGVYVGEGLVAEFRNGKPNPVNMLLWQLSLANLARDIARDCGTTVPVRMFTLTDELTDVLKNLCQWPSPDAKDAQTIARLWTIVMRWDAPIDEIVAFTELFQGPDYAAVSAQETVAGMLTAIMYNPHFLLRK